MPFARCRYYEDDGSRIGAGCLGQGGRCEFVHPSERNWAKAPRSRGSFASSSDRGRGRGAGRGRGRGDGGGGRGGFPRSPQKHSRQDTGGQDAGWGAPLAMSNAWDATPVVTSGSSSNETGGWGGGSGWADASNIASGSTSAQQDSTGWGAGEASKDDGPGEKQKDDNANTSSADDGWGDTSGGWGDTSTSWANIPPEPNPVATTSQAPLKTPSLLPPSSPKASLDASPESNRQSSGLAKDRSSTVDYGTSRLEQFSTSSRLPRDVSKTPGSSKLFTRTDGTDQTKDAMGNSTAPLSLRTRFEYSPMEIDEPSSRPLSPSKRKGDEDIRSELSLVREVRASSTVQDGRRRSASSRCTTPTSPQPSSKRRVAEVKSVDSMSRQERKQAWLNRLRILLNAVDAMRIHTDAKNINEKHGFTLNSDVHKRIGIDARRLLEAKTSQVKKAAAEAKKNLDDCIVELVEDDESFDQPMQYLFQQNQDYHSMREDAENMKSFVEGVREWLKPTSELLEDMVLKMEENSYVSAPPTIAPPPSAQSSSKPTSSQPTKSFISSEELHSLQRSLEDLSYKVEELEGRFDELNDGSAVEELAKRKLGSSLDFDMSAFEQSVCGVQENMAEIRGELAELRRSQAEFNDLSRRCDEHEVKITEGMQQLKQERDQRVELQRKLELETERGRQTLAKLGEISDSTDAPQTDGIANISDELRDRLVLEIKDKILAEVRPEIEALEKNTLKTVEEKHAETIRMIWAKCAPALKATNEIWSVIGATPRARKLSNGANSSGSSVHAPVTPNHL